MAYSIIIIFREELKNYDVEGISYNLIQYTIVQGKKKVLYSGKLVT